MLATGTALAADPPGQPTITNAIPGWQRGEIILDWNAPDTNANGILGYEIRVSSDLGDNWLVPPINTKSPAPTEYTLTGLNPDLSYVFQVRAYNDGSVNSPAGRGDWSRTSINPVQPAGNVGPPTFLSTQAQDRAVLVSWIPVDAAAAYQVQYSTSNNGPWSSSTSTVDDHKLIDGLDPAKSYFFQVRSYNGPQDFSTWVVTTNATSPLGSPNAPTNVNATAGNASASVSWTAPAGGATSYEVQYRAGSGAWSSTISATATSATVTGLTNGTSYNFQVRAIRSGTPSAWVASNSVTPVAPAVVPTAPTSVSATGIDSAAVISWTMQANQPVTTYLIQYSLNNSQWFPTTPISTGRVDQTYVLGGLSNGQPYYIRVAAANGNLASAFTQLAGTVTPVSVPGPPQFVNGVAGNGQVSLTWQQPNIVRPTSTITGYQVQYSSTGGAVWQSAPDVTTPTTATTVTGLQNGVGYIFRVRATSYAGVGAWSANTGVITPPGGPTPPSSVAATAGNSRATVSWIAPINSSSAIVGYRVTAAPGGQTCTTSAVPPSTPATACVVTGLTNGQPYTFTVVAVTTSGTSAPSAPSNAVTPSGPTASITITQSGRNGSQVFARGTTTGLTSGTTVTALIRNKAGAAFRPAGQVAVQDDGTFSWSTNTGKKTWIRFTSGGVTSSTVIVGAR